MKALKLFPLLCVALLAGCSSDDIAGTDGNGVADKSAVVVESSGLESITVVAPKGTTSLVVSYKTEGGKTQELIAPFTADKDSKQDRSTLIKGVVKLYSATPALVEVKTLDNNVLASDVYLPGTSLKGGSVSAYPEAHFFVRLSETVSKEFASGGQASEQYYPQTKSGGSYFGDLNKGTVKIGDDSGYSLGDGGVKTYIYSPDGTGTKEVLDEVPDFFGNKYQIFPSKIANQINEDEYEIIWYTIKKQDGEWHVDGILKKKSESTGGDDSVTPVPQPETPTFNGSGIYHFNGTMMWDADGDKDYNDLVVDYDVEYRGKNSGQSPYVKIVMHFRAMGADAKNYANVDRINFDFSCLDKYMAANDDFDITFATIKVGDVDNMKDYKPSDGSYKGIPFWTGGDHECGLVPGWDKHNGTNNSAFVKGLQWILTNQTEGWYDLHNGNYNLTQESLNGKPFATLQMELHPTQEYNSMTETEVREGILSILSQLAIDPNFSFSTADGHDCGSKVDYIIAPSMTPHVAEGYTFEEAFPLYGTSDSWYKNWTDEPWTDENGFVHVNEHKNYNADKVVDIH